MPLCLGHSFASPLSNGTYILPPNDPEYFLVINANIVFYRITIARSKSYKFWPVIIKILINFFIETILQVENTIDTELSASEFTLLSAEYFFNLSIIAICLF